VLEYSPTAFSRGREAAAPAFWSAPRPRAQHTFGSIGENLFPALAPDLKTLYFASSRQGPRFAVFKKALGGSAVTAVTGGPWSDIHPAISPDGRRLAFASDREGSFAIYLKDEGHSGALCRITRPGGEALGPSWSPDARQLAFFRRDPGGRCEVWTVDVENGEEKLLGPGLFPCWSPDGSGGQWIAYQLARERDGGWYTIWKMRPDGSQATQLVLNENWGAVHPTWSPDGLWLAFAAVGKSPESRRPGSEERADDVYLISAEGTNLTNLTADRGGVAEWNPSFGPDGRIYFDSDEGDAVNIWSLEPGVRPHPPETLPVTAAAPEDALSPRAAQVEPEDEASAPAMESGLGSPTADSVETTGESR
jgi:Tol biopolymer transport system component